MTTRKPIDTVGEPLGVGLIVEDFRAVEMLREQLATIGWTADYRQLEGGRLQARLAIREADGLGFVRMALSHRVFGLCRSPDDMFTIAMSVSKNGLRVNGHGLNQERLLVIPPKTDFHVTSVGSGWSLQSLLVSADILAEHLETQDDDHPLVDTKKITPFKLSKTQLAPFRRLVVGAMSQSLSALIGAVEESDFAAITTRLLARPESVKKVGDPYRRLEKRRIITRAIDYVHEHFSEVIHITDLCKYNGVSLSTLERIFTRELGIGPYGYIRAVRLHEVRRALLDPNGKDLTIADIAMNCGFTHMGRFSRRYHAHFGRLPSEELSLVNGTS